MKFVLLITLLAITCWSQGVGTKDEDNEEVVTVKGAEEIRSRGVTWDIVDANKSVFKGMTKKAFQKKLQGRWPDPPDKNSELKCRDGPRLMQDESEPIPAFFDGREQWGQCIHSGRDQLECSGCWAFGIANHLSDRFCVAGKDVVLSVQDLLECTPGNNCCEGGSAENGYKFLMVTGLVDERCKPYDSKCKECRPSGCPRYRCERNSAWVTSNAERAKREIMENGPITGIFDVYDDFAYYRGGIYSHSSQKKVGVHSITILGWGNYNGVPYWICKNSWGDNWGLYSFFMIMMGDAGIDSYMTSCKPLIEG